MAPLPLVKKNNKIAYCMSISVADPGFDIGGGGVNFVNGGGWVGVFGGDH